MVWGVALLLSLVGAAFGGFVPSPIAVGDRATVDAPRNEPTLVVGLVTASSARILADVPWEAGAFVVVNRVVREMSENGEADAWLESTTAEMHLPSTIGKSPRLLLLKNLHRGTHYVVTFHKSPKKDDTSAPDVDFVTPGGVSSSRVAFYSCDRVVEDADEGFIWPVLRAFTAGSADAGGPRAWATGVSAALAGPPPFDLKVGLGDQIYADQAVARLLAANRSISHQRAVEEFRGIYRVSWSKYASRRAFFRRGALVTVPDDHDVVNNLAHWMIQHGDDKAQASEDEQKQDEQIGSKEKSWIEWMLRRWAAKGGVVEDPIEHIPRLHISHLWKRKTNLKGVVMAGRQAFIEFQLRLVQNVPDDVAHDFPDIPPPDELTLPRAALEEEEKHLGKAAQELSHTYEPVLGRTSVKGHAPTQVALVVGELGLLLPDTRHDRTFAQDPLAPLLSREQLADTLLALRQLHRDARVQEIVVATSVPLLWMDGPLAHLAYVFEDDEYPTLASQRNATAALLEIISASGKLSHLVAGDVHVGARTLVCDGAIPGMPRDEATVPWKRKSRWPPSSPLSKKSIDDAQVADMDDDVIAEFRGTWTIVADALSLVGGHEDATHVRRAMSRVVGEGMGLEADAATLGAWATWELRPILHRWIAGANAPPLDAPTRCIAGLISSGVSTGSSALTHPHITLFVGALWWYSQPFAGHWSGRIDDVWGGNNIVVLDVGRADPTLAGDRAARFRRHAEEIQRTRKHPHPDLDHARRQLRYEARHPHSHVRAVEDEYVSGFGTSLLVAGRWWPDRWWADAGSSVQATSPPGSAPGTSSGQEDSVICDISRLRTSQILVHACRRPLRGFWVFLQRWLEVFWFAFPIVVVVVISSFAMLLYFLVAIISSLCFKVDWSTEESRTQTSLATKDRGQVLRNKSNGERNVRRARSSVRRRRKKLHVE